MVIMGRETLKHLATAVQLGVWFGLFLVLIGMARPAAAADQEEAVVNTIYDFTVQPLTVEECARCHFSHFSRLRERGGKHGLVACTECHVQYHTYNPRLNNFGAIMPRCDLCHDLPHGSDEALRLCQGCHADPHQPLATLPAPADLENSCPSCHAGVAASLRQQPSKHTEQECSSCHSEKHGRIPVCGDCHESHSPLLEMVPDDCLACHPVHTPLQIVYPVEQDKRLCAGCHNGPFELLAANPTRHSAFTCAKCHPAHGQIMACRQCHVEPHGAAIHEKFSACGECHGIAHDLGH